MWHVCEPQTGCTQELPTTAAAAAAAAASPLHILQQRQVSSSHMPLLFEMSCSSAMCCSKERTREGEKKNVKPHAWTLLWQEWQHALPMRHLGSAIVTTMDTACPSNPLKLTRADQQPALSNSMGTAGWFRVTEPVTCPNKARVSWLCWDINKCHSAWSAHLITADFSWDKWNNHTKVTFTKHRLVQKSLLVSFQSIPAHLPMNEHFAYITLSLLKHGLLWVQLHQHTFTLFCVGFALLLQKGK